MTKNHWNTYDLVALIGFAVWLGGSWYFGWNDTAITTGERYTDTIGIVLMGYGFLNSIARGIKPEVTIKINTAAFEVGLEEEKPAH
jgi:hypothetical protein